MCGTPNSSVDTRIKYAKKSGTEFIAANVSISSKNRMAISTLFMKFNLYGLVIAWKQMAHTKITPCSSDVWEDKRW